MIKSMFYTQYLCDICKGGSPWFEVVQHAITWIEQAGWVRVDQQLYCHSCNLKRLGIKCECAKKVNK